MSDTGPKTVKLSLRIEDAVHAALSAMARETCMETGAYIIHRLNKIAAESDYLDARTAERLTRTDELLVDAAKKARALYDAGEFDEHFTLTVIRRLMADQEYLRKYEALIGGDAYDSGLPGKSPINMYLGWHIKHAVNADVVPNARGKPRRAQVRGEAVQSYTLLRRPAA